MNLNVIVPARVARARKLPVVAVRVVLLLMFTVLILDL